jgi:threonylcarbamoyladenosine tRNA methylthiotransferase MtaB
MTGPVTVAVSTLGCRLNQVESQELRGLFERHGFRMVEAGEPAQVHVVNTCTVTARADVSGRQAIRRLVRAAPEALLVATGCYAQTDPEALARIAGVDLVVGNQDKYRLPELIGSLVKRARAEVRVGPIDGAPHGGEPAVADAPGRSRAFVKIQDGCQHRCAFCIVPAARGPSRSRSPEAVLRQVRELTARGYRDLTLTGVDIGHYGWDQSPRTSLAALLGRVAEVPGLAWVRLSSVLPAYFTPELIDVVTGAPQVAPHLHLPLQSGSDRVLRLMRRPYTVAAYRRLVERLATAIPALGLGADLIAGHPGESPEDFAATETLVGELPFSYLHVFSYSARPGTEAAGRGEHLAPAVVRQRSRRLRSLARDKSLAFRRQLVGQRREVVVLETRDPDTGLSVGLTSNYVQVRFAGAGERPGGLATLRVVEAGPRHTAGVLAEPAA